MIPGDVISYIEMCQHEDTSLQRGMNYRIKGGKTVILMSVRENSPYQDKVEDEGKTLIYEGHDIARNNTHRNPKEVDQPEQYPSGSLTENGKFLEAAKNFKEGKAPPENVTVYEKIKPGIWVYNGIFDLLDGWTEEQNGRSVFKFKLTLNEQGRNESVANKKDLDHNRLIPTSVKLEVWKRDGGKCVKCGATEHLHFDHIIPYSKGGTSLTSKNIQLLCLKHNLSKSDNIA